MMTLTAEMTTAVERLMKAASDDFRAWSERCAKAKPYDTTDPTFETKMRAERIAKFEEGLTYEIGKKYIKVVSDRSVWGFVVNTDTDKKFNYGDILKAASWATPARNFPRGNVFKEYNAAWTGA